ncbi:sulfur carrier protein ThiS [SAR202 cluster bacterium AD-804-J14_MRT_500m]|nr:sulfur carrier protein ThiS [SAR202 cluster bacterium AD-804-J14_MRT_500m]
MILTVNGKPRHLVAPTNLLEFLESLEINTKFVAVGHNGDVLDKEDFDAVILDHGDVLEIVRPVGGG